MPHKDPEKNKAYRKAYKQTAKYKAYAKKARIAYSPYRIAHPEKEMFHAAKERSKKKGLDFTIEESDIVIPVTCPILGMPLVSCIGSGSGPKDDSPSLDRIDASKGYVKGNVEVISWRANRIKYNATSEELSKIAAHSHRSQALRQNYDYQFGQYEPGL